MTEETGIIVDHGNKCIHIDEEVDLLDFINMVLNEVGEKQFDKFTIIPGSFYEFTEAELFDDENYFEEGDYGFEEN